jgi:formylmethanofuran dehydrogenase subunit E
MSDNKITVATLSKCDSCGSLGADTYTYEGNEWTICKSCEAISELAIDSYLADIRGE